jgi:Trypsin-co-occurring domain 1
MPQLTPIQLDDGTTIYIEATENATVTPSPEVASNADPDEEQEVARGGQKGWVQDQLNRTHPQAMAAQSFKAIEGTIRAYTTYTLNAFQQIAVANIDKVTLEFGIEISGEAGVPYVTKGTATSNLTITVECSFPSNHAS